MMNVQLVDELREIADWFRLRWSPPSKRLEKGMEQKEQA